ncbi:MAG: aminotransferase class V-fold PLP-dependent enzyme [Thermoanaerobaculia bacterium]
MHTSSRRTFLERAALGAAAMPVVEQLLSARRVFAQELEATVPAASGALATDAYTLDPGVTYLNHASIGTIPAVVQNARRRYLEICETNPWFYMWSGEWDQPRERVRGQAAELLGCDAAEVAFTHNTTEAFNVLALGLPLGKGDEVLFSSLNHSGASACWEHHAAERGYRVRRFDFPLRQVPRLESAEILDLYDRQIQARTRVLVLPHLDNTLGLRHPVAEIARLARDKGVRFIAVDGAQTVGMLPVDVSAMGVDVYATSPHKWLQAPKGLGLIYVRREIQDQLRPMWVTWGQQRWQGTARVYEDYGTRNLAEVLALGDAIEFQQHLGAAAKEAHHRRLWNHARRLVEASPRLSWRSPTSWELSGALYAVEVEGKNSRELFASLFQEHGFVLRPFATEGLQTLRLSPNVANTRDDLDRLFALL